MNGLHQLTVVFVGHFATFSGLLGVPPNRFEVQDGRTRLVGSEPDVKAMALHLRNMYQGFPEGSPELEACQAAVAASAAASPTPPAGEVRDMLDTTINELPADMVGQADTVVHNLRVKFGPVFSDDDEVRVRLRLDPEQQEKTDGSSALQAGAEVPNGPANVPGAVLSDGGSPAEGAAVPGDGAAGPAAGGDGAGAVGNGQEHLVNGEPAPNAPNAKLVRALAKLDPENNDHWTADGKPSVAAVEQLYGSSDVRRKDIDAAAPGLTRASARAALSKTE